jgi:MFS family permease
MPQTRRAPCDPRRRARGGRCGILLSAFSYPVAGYLGTKFGLVNTIVFTHLHAAACLIIAVFTPNLTVVLILLLVRSALSQMDVPTRTSYVLAVVTPAERPAAASFTAVPRSLAASISPAISGALLRSERTHRLHAVGSLAYSAALARRAANSTIMKPLVQLFITTRAPWRRVIFALATGGGPPNRLQPPFRNHRCQRCARRCCHRHHPKHRRGTRSRSSPSRRSPVRRRRMLPQIDLDRT